MKADVEEILQAGAQWRSRPIVDIDLLQQRGAVLKRRRWLQRAIALFAVVAALYLGITVADTPLSGNRPILPAGEPDVLPDTCGDEPECTDTPQGSEEDDEFPDPADPGYVVPGPKVDGGN